MIIVWLLLIPFAGTFTTCVTSQSITVTTVTLPNTSTTPEHTKKGKNWLHKFNTLNNQVNLFYC